ncbi:hypothetical protein COCNU_02G011330 [Cocos nucifera]|uniref:Uncharacterized protein n=1 Tax=Cocos nucifera TaxID=13894 RepID=A0A8K0HZP0_COCNU|nr:hypothetical protein COCNU_02G011330 [Cocos nucifera]
MEEKKIMEKKKREKEERKREEEKKVEAKKKKKEKNKGEDKPKMLTYSLERRIKKEHRVRKASHLIEDRNYETRMSTKKTKTEPKSKEVSFLGLSKSKEGFIEHSRECQDKGSLSEKDDGIIEMFLSERINSEIVFNNAEGGSITRSNLHDLLFAWMIIDDQYIMS